MSTEKDPTRLEPIEGITREGTEKIVEETLAVYNEKARKKRAPHMGPNEPQNDTCGVKSNKKVVPGVMSARGCAYAGAKGVVWGPIRDMVHVSHGPVGCGYYSWGTRRNMTTGPIGVTNFTPIDFTSDFQERDIVYGGDAKLEKLIREADQLFPLNKGVSVLSECPVGLIGDDINAVCKKMEGELGKMVVPCNCEGFRGVSQSLGHHISNDSIRDHVIGKRTFGEKAGPYDIALIGEYNIGGDAWSSKALLEECGFNIKATWTGDGEIERIAASNEVQMALIHCYRSMNYMCRVMEEKWGIPWMEFNIFGPTKIAQSLRAIAEHFDDYIKDNVEKVIAKYEPQMKAIIDEYKPRLEGKKVMLLVGGLRPRHTVGAYEDLGMEVVASGYEFAHQDDYDRTQADMKSHTLIFDDPAEWELEKWAHDLGVDLIGSGIKEKYVFQKMGLPFRQMHSWDYSGPYHGYMGFPVFARDMDMAVNSPTWGLVKSPF